LTTVGTSYLLWDSDMALAVAILLSISVLGACSLVFIIARPVSYLRDLAIDFPVVTVGRVVSNEQQDYSGELDSTGGPAWCIELEGGQRFNVTWIVYERIKSGDLVSISQYPHTGLVAGISKVS
jgi:hypothetical protein